MSRIGRKSISLPKDVTITQKDGACIIKGPRGHMEVAIPRDVKMEVAGGVARMARQTASAKEGGALYGLAHQMVANAVEGVSKGFSRRLEVNGVGYRVEMKGKNLEMEIGFSHPVRFAPPAGVTLSVEEKNVVVVAGVNKQQVGQTAANLRAIKPPDPYKAKGIKYAEEVVHRKVGKKGA